MAAQHSHFLYTGEGVTSSVVEEFEHELKENLRERPSNSANIEITCCVIKPHALQKTGTILREIADSGLSIGAMQSFRLTNPTATEFLEVYRTTLKEYPQVKRGHYTAGIAGPCDAWQLVRFAFVILA